MSAIKFKFWAGVCISSLLLLGSAYTAGVYVGKHAERLAQAEEDRKQLVESISWVRNKELELIKETSNVSTQYEKEIASINADATAAKSELGRLRVKAARACGMPTNSSSSQPKGATQGATNGDTAGEVNLDSTANDILQLGYDIDVANAQITGLLKVVDLCEGRSTK